MHRQKVFIAWSGENKRLAEKFGALLPQAEFHPIVGGEDEDASMYVSQTIINQMNQAELAVLIFEPRPQEKGGGISYNVMFEWGYLLHKLPTGRRIQIYLLNMTEKDLPSDVSGCWAFMMDKAAGTTEAEKEKIFDDLAVQMCVQFVTKVKQGYKEQDKLDYFDNWEENQQFIIHYDGTSRIAYKLMFGMQMSVYSGRSGSLYEALNLIRGQLPPHWEQTAQQRELTQVITCVMEMLRVFIATRNLSVPMTALEYAEIQGDLVRMLNRIQNPRTCAIRDPDLRSWCRIFLEDKLELCYEFAADSQPPKRRLELLHSAAEQCELMIRLNEEQVKKNSRDENYALLYRAFAHRNLFLISKRLLETEDLDIHRDNIRLHCAKSLECREQLYDHYYQDRQRSTTTMDYVTQEYLLGLVEQYEFEDDQRRKRAMLDEIRALHRKVKNDQEIRGIIYNRIEEAIAKVPELKEN